jgi:MYXO-CTERM domain-containing protein
MVMKGMTLASRILFYGGVVVALGVGGLQLSAVPASAGVGEAELIVGTGTGIPGGTASVPISLANDPTSQGVSADLDIAYPADVVEFIPPVNQNCQVADRISSTHIVAGTIPQPGLLRLAVTNTQGLEPLGNGEIANCDFHVLPGVATGTAALNVDFAELTGAEGMVPVVGVDGAIIVSEATPTPTVTNTPPVTATNTGGVATNTVAATATATVSGTVPTATATSGTPTVPTATHTSGTPPGGTPTATRSVSATSGTPGTPTASPTGATRTPTGPTRTPTGGGPSPSNEDDGCNIVSTGQSSAGGMLALLLAPALLVWARRKRF